MTQMIFLDLTDADGSKVYVDAFDISIIQPHSFATKQGFVPADPYGTMITTKAGMPVLVTEKPNEILDKMLDSAWKAVWCERPEPVDPEPVDPSIVRLIPGLEGESEFADERRALAPRPELP